MKYIKLCYITSWISLSLFLLGNYNATAQQEVLYSQYMFNGLVINPAYAGSNDVLSITAGARKQWTGIEGTPNSQTLSVHSPLKKENISVGLILINDNIGVTHQFGLSAIYAYRIKWNKKNKLSMGLQLGGTQYQTRYSSLATRTIGDNSFSSDEISGVIPSFGAGIYFNNDVFYLGLSVPHLINNFFKDTVASTNIFQRRHYMATLGCIFPLLKNIKMKPSLLFKSAEGASSQLDINTNFIIKDVLWIGGSLRNFDWINILTQFQLTDQLRFGYSYDFPSFKPNSINKGSHEISINYNFSFIKNMVVTPRYF